MIVGRQIQERRTGRGRRRRRRNSTVTSGVVSPRRGGRNPGQTCSPDVSEQVGAPILRNLNFIHRSASTSKGVILTFCNLCDKALLLSLHNLIMSKSDSLYFERIKMINLISKFESRCKKVFLQSTFFFLDPTERNMIRKKKISKHSRFLILLPIGKKKLIDFFSNLKHKIACMSHSLKK
jgi:hypothetical protein